MSINKMIIKNICSEFFKHIKNTNDLDIEFDEIFSSFACPDEITKKLSKVTGEKPKKKKDSNAPKKPSSAYIFFCSDHRENMKKENPEISSKEILSTLGKMWKALDSDDKEEYTKRAAEDKERYVREMGEYTPSDSEKSEKKTRDPSSYNNFYKLKSAELKREDPEVKITRKMIIDLWKELSDEEKKKYADIQVAQEPKKEKAVLENPKPRRKATNIEIDSRKPRGVPRKSRAEKEKELEEQENDEKSEAEEAIDRSVPAQPEPKERSRKTDEEKTKPKGRKVEKEEDFEEEEKEEVKPRKKNRLLKSKNIQDELVDE